MEIRRGDKEGESSEYKRCIRRERDSKGGTKTAANISGEKRTLRRATKRKRRRRKMQRKMMRRGQKKKRKTQRKQRKKRLRLSRVLWHQFSIRPVAKARVESMEVQTRV